MTKTQEATVPDEQTLILELRDLLRDVLQGKDILTDKNWLKRALYAMGDS